MLDKLTTIANARNRPHRANRLLTYSFGTLQAAPAVTGTYTNVPGATSPYTNALTGPQKYFRPLLQQLEKDNL